jgi:hypothetical protein
LPRTLLDAGIDPRSIQFLLGQRDFETTSKYLHISEARLHDTRCLLGELPIQIPAMLRKGTERHEGILARNGDIPSWSSGLAAWSVLRT